MRKEGFRGLIVLWAIISTIIIFTMYYNTVYLKYVMWLNLLPILYPPLFFYFKKKKENTK